MASAVIKFSAIFMLIGICIADIGSQPVTEVCLICICQAISDCNQSLQCEGDTCGLFRITWAYWADAGKPTLPGYSPDSPEAYPKCANDPLCAAQAVQGYMGRFGRDCNNDGLINCYDYMEIHKKRDYRCGGESLPFDYVNVFNQCIATFVLQQQNQG